MLVISRTISVYTDVFLTPVIDGWDISPMNLADAMVRAKVIDYDLQQKLRKEMLAMKPRPAIYDPDFIAANQVRWFPNSLYHLVSTKAEKRGDVALMIKTDFVISTPLRLAAVEMDHV